MFNLAIGAFDKKEHKKNITNNINRMDRKLLLFILPLLIFIALYFSLPSQKEGFTTSLVNYKLQDGIYAMRPKNQKWCADDNGNRVNCNRSWIQSWEKFELKNIGNDIVQLKGGRIGNTCQLKYNSKQKEYQMSCDTRNSSIQPNKVWKLVNRPGSNRYFLRSLYKDMGCSAGGDNQLVCQKNRVVLFEYSNFKGKTRTYRIGNNISSLGNFNNKLSSLIVSKGVTVELFKYNGYRQRIATYTGPEKIKQIGDNDQVSSLKVYASGVQVFEDSNMRGKSFTLNPGNYKLHIKFDDKAMIGPWLIFGLIAKGIHQSATNDGRPFENTISSVHIPSGYKIYAYDDRDYRKLIRVIKPGNYSNLDNHLNDKISSIKVIKTNDHSSEEFEIKLIKANKQKKKGFCPDPKYSEFNPTAFSNYNYKKSVRQNIKHVLPNYKANKKLCKNKNYHRDRRIHHYNNQEFFDLITTALDDTLKSNYIQHTKRDFPGNDIRQVNNATVNKCKNITDHTKGAVGFTIVKNRCWIKRKMRNKKKHSTSTSYVKNRKNSDKKISQLQRKLQIKMDHVYKISCEILKFRKRDFNSPYYKKHKRNLPIWFGIINDASIAGRKHEHEDNALRKGFQKELDQIMNLSREIQFLKNSAKSSCRNPNDSSPC